MLHDPSLYPHPDEVIPERYLDRIDGSLNPDPKNFAFGYGRRYVASESRQIESLTRDHPSACPGRMFAEDTLFVTAASVLASFNVSDAVAPKGGKVIYSSGVIRSANIHFTSSTAHILLQPP